MQLNSVIKINNPGLLYEDNPRLFNGITLKQDDLYRITDVDYYGCVTGIRNMETGESWGNEHLDSCGYACFFDRNDLDEEYILVIEGYDNQKAVDLLKAARKQINEALRLLGEE